MKRLKFFGEKGRRSKVSSPEKGQESDTDESQKKSVSVLFKLDPKVATLEDAPKSVKQSAERAKFVTTGPFMYFPGQLINKENAIMTTTGTKNETTTEDTQQNQYSYEVKGHLVTAGSELNGYSIFDDISSYEDRYDGKYRVVLSTPVLMKNGTTLPRGYEISEFVEQEIQTGIMAVRLTVAQDFLEQVDSEHSDFGANAYLNVAIPVGIEQTNSKGETQMPKTTQTEEPTVTEVTAPAQDQTQAIEPAQTRDTNTSTSSLILKERLVRKDGLILAPGSDLTQFATNKIEYEFTPEFMSKIAMNTATALLQDDPEHPSITAGYTRQVDDKSLLKRDLPLSDGIVYAAGSDVTKFVNQKSVTTLSQEFLDSIDEEQTPLSVELYTHFYNDNEENDQATVSDQSTTTFDATQYANVDKKQTIAADSDSKSLEEEVLTYLKDDLGTEGDHSNAKFLAKVAAFVVKIFQLHKEEA